MLLAGTLKGDFGNNIIVSVGFISVIQYYKNRVHKLERSIGLDGDYWDYPAFGSLLVTYWATITPFLGRFFPSLNIVHRLVIMWSLPVILGLVAVYVYASLPSAKKF